MENNALENGTVEKTMNNFIQAEKGGCKVRSSRGPTLVKVGKDFAILII